MIKKFVFLWVFLGLSAAYGSSLRGYPFPYLANCNIQMSQFLAERSEPIFLRNTTLKNHEVIIVEAEALKGRDIYSSLEGSDYLSSFVSDIAGVHGIYDRSFSGLMKVNRLSNGSQFIEGHFQVIQGKELDHHEYTMQSSTKTPISLLNGRGQFLDIPAPRSFEKESQVVDSPLEFGQVDVLVLSFRHKTSGFFVAGNTGAAFEIPANSYAFLRPGTFWGFLPSKITQESQVRVVGLRRHPSGREQF